MSKDKCNCMDELLKDLPIQPSRVHNMFKRVMKKLYDQREGQIDRFLDECAAYLVSITNRQDEGLRHAVEMLLNNCPFTSAMGEERIKFDVPAYKITALRKALETNKGRFVK